jgi:hypothetical protein
MTTIENVIETGTTVVLDGKFFIHCKYTGCNVIFLGGEYGWFDTEFKDCKVLFQGAAMRTVELLKRFNIMPANVESPKPVEQSGTT